MSEVDLFFDKYVAWMRRDIQREVDLEIQTKDAGNLLCALGLLVYTEALGRLRRWNFERETSYDDRNRDRPAENFRTTFDRLGGGTYGTWRTDWERRNAGASIYDVLRNGMVHEYRPKISAALWFGHDEPMGVSETELEEKNDDGSIRRQPAVVLYIVPYLNHFTEEAQQLRTELTASGNPALPPSRLSASTQVRTASAVSSSDPGAGLGLITPSTFNASPLVSGSSVASGADLSRLSPKERRDFGK